MNVGPLSSEFNAENYKAAATEHIAVARDLYEAGHYVLANYVAGLAVECILRAYRLRNARMFDARHDIRELEKQSKFSELFPANRYADYKGYITIVARQWANSHRYRSEKALRKHLKAARLHRDVTRGDYLEELTRRLVYAATELVSLGDSLWQRPNPQA